MNLGLRSTLQRRTIAATALTLLALATGLSQAGRALSFSSSSAEAKGNFPPAPLLFERRETEKQQVTLQKNDDQLNELLVLGREQVDAGDLSGALVTYRQSARLDDSNPLIFSAIGYLESLRENYPEAIEFYKKAIALDPQETRFHYALGYAYAQNGQYVEAEAAYQDVVTLDPDHLNATLGLGATRFRQERYSDALLAYERASAIAPNAMQIDGFRGSTLLQLGRYEEAILRLVRVTPQAPNYFDTQVNLGTALLNVGRDREAFAAFDRAERVTSDNGQLLYDLGQILLDRGDPERAGRYYRRASTLDNAPSLQLDIGRALLATGDSLYAVLTLREAVKQLPDEPEVHVALSEALQAQNRRDEAIAELETARDLYDARGNAEKVAELTDRLDEF